MEVFEGATFHLFYALAFLGALTALLTRALMKPEQRWYRCRALAESVKTLTWRYMMRAAPFAQSSKLPMARSEFRNHLQALLDENRSVAEMIASDWADESQITDEMDRIRELPLSERVAFYGSERVKEQRTWYSRKAGENKRSSRRWVLIGVLAYVVAIALALSRIEFPDWRIWPIDPVIVFASSLVGWVQIKKFNELGAAYTVTAHEIGLIAPRLQDVASETDLSECVNDAELAFSREHTLWIARQSS